MNASRITRLAPSATRLENVGFGSTGFAMALAGAVVLGAPALGNLGTHVSEWKETCVVLFTVAGQALGFFG